MSPGDKTGPHCAVYSATMGQEDYLRSREVLDSATLDTQMQHLTLKPH